MVNNTLNKREWNSIVNTYFNGYCMSLQNQIKRRSYRALYLANQEYLKNNRLKINQYPNTTFIQLQQYNKWYLNYYHKNIPLSKGNNIIPWTPFNN